MREEFEKLSEIAEHLKHGHVIWSFKHQKYISEFSSMHVVACYLNGAWYAYQEQQKKIDAALKLLKIPHYGYAAAIASIGLAIEELLK